MGDIVSVDPGVIASVADSGFVPVVAPIGVDEAGLTYNVNADEAAGAIATALGAEKLMLLTDVEGVRDAGGELIHQLTVEEARKHIDEGSISGGMMRVVCPRNSVACSDTSGKAALTRGSVG